MLQLYIASQLAVVSDDTSISIEETSPIWNPDAGGAFSLEFKLDAELNRHIIGNADLVRGASVFKQLNGKPFKLFIDGLPFRSGIVRLSDEVSIDNGFIPISLASGNLELNDMVADLNCQDVSVDDDILIGQTVHSLEAECEVYRSGTYLGLVPHIFWDGFGKETHSIPLPSKDVLIPSVGSVPVTNTSVAYPDAKFCNVRLCYPKQTKDASGSWSRTREYSLVEPSPAPSFFVLYFLDRLFRQIGLNNNGVAVTRNDLESIEDFRRLAFFNSNPCFRAGESVTREQIAMARPKWIREEVASPSSLNEFERYGYPLVVERPTHYEHYLDSGVKTLPEIYDLGVYYYDNNYQQFPERDYRPALERMRRYFPEFSFSKVKGSIADVSSSFIPIIGRVDIFSVIGNAYATSENFPDTEVSSVLSILQNAFCLRFVFDSNNHTVKLVLVRNVLRDPAIHDVDCTIHSVSKRERDIRGFELAYSASNVEEEAKAKDKTEYYNSNDNSTAFDYNDWSNISKMPYYVARNSVGAYNKMTMYNPDTANAYRVKVDKDAKSQQTLYPSLVEVAQFNPAQYGDCSDREHIETVSIDFTPVLLNDVSPYSDQHPKYAVFVDADIHGQEETELKDNGFATDEYPYGPYQSQRGYLTPSLDYKFKSPANYDRSANSESPLFKPNDSVMFGLMRGIGGGSGVTTNNINYDGEGNDNWIILSGEGAFHFDSVDDYGNVFDGSRVVKEEKVYTKEEAKDEILNLFSSSNANLIVFTRKVSWEKMNAAGWDTEVGSISTYFSSSVGLQDNNGIFEFIVTPILDDGTVLTREQLNNYLAQLEGMVSSNQSILDLDAKYKKIIIGKYSSISSAEDYAEMLHQLGAVWYGDDASGIVLVDTVVYSSPDDTFSLRLRAEKPNPDFNPDVPESPENPRWLPVRDDLARRGIYDKFYAEYAYFTTHRKTAVLSCTLTLAQILNFDFSKRYRFGVYVGFINRMSYSINSANGLSDVSIELYYI